MKLASYRRPGSAGPRIGVLAGERLVDLTTATQGALPSEMIPFLNGGEAAMAQARAVERQALADNQSGRLADRADTVALADVELLAPVPRPGKILHTACNFPKHLDELTEWNSEEWKAHGWSGFHFEHPTGFLQASSCVVGSGRQVAIPSFTRQLDYEIEIALVIGTTAKDVSRADALSYVAGVTIFNDLSARDIQAREHANNVILLGKSFDGSCPLGPFLVTLDELPADLAMPMRLTVNGIARQEASTGQMFYKPDQLVSWWSKMTLEPGDVITSGSPPGVAAGMAEPAWLKHGDIVEAKVEGLGTLVTHIVEEPQ